MRRILALVGIAAAFGGASWAQESEPPPVDQLPVEATMPATALTPALVVEAEPVWTGPVVTLQTTMGDIVITLDTVGAPKTAAQFLKLVKSGHYNGAAFYRIEPGFVIQLGDLDANLKYRPANAKPVPLETANNRHARGAVALARADETDSGVSTFYIDMAENTGLGAKPDAPPNTTGYAVFGHVTSGMEVADAIAGTELASEGGPFPGKLPKTPIVVRKATVTKTE